MAHENIRTTEQLRTGNGHRANPGGGDPSAVADLGRELASLASRLSGPLHRLSVRSGDCEIAVEWGAAAPAGPVLEVARGATAPLEPVEAPGVATVAVRAPLVGTYYAASAPDAEPFVRVGDAVERGQTVAIVEAMKMMNPVVAEQPGVVVELCVGNGDPVEFDQPLVALLPGEVAA